MLKRLFDIGISTVGLVAATPILLVLACWIKLDSPGPIFFRQERIGRGGAPFLIFKFRTMVKDAPTRGGQLTVRDDSRITRSGRWLRRSKLDELPQLINVLRGEMSFVGPRPEVARYVARYPEEARKSILSVRPGITDLASINFRNESDLLRGSSDPDSMYVEKILPIKIRYYQEYVQSRSLALDIKIIILTLVALIRG